MTDLAKWNRELEKENYWKGFRACLILVLLPLILFTLVVVNIFINNNL